MIATGTFITRLLSNEEQRITAAVIEGIPYESAQSAGRMTPHAYLLQQRVRLARQLLAAGRSPAQAAAEAGFADQSHLTRAFHRQLGVTPARYRAAVT